VDDPSKQATLEGANREVASPGGVLAGVFWDQPLNARR
jgi:hypothetical protein